MAETAHTEDPSRQLLRELADEMREAEPGSDKRAERLEDIKELLGRMFGGTFDVF